MQLPGVQVRLAPPAPEAETLTLLLVAEYRPESVTFAENVWLPAEGVIVVEKVGPEPYLVSIWLPSMKNATCVTGNLPWVVLAVIVNMLPLLGDAESETTG